MTSEEQQKMIGLCNQIQVEKNYDRFMTLIEELNKILERKQNRLEKLSLKPTEK